MHNPNLRLIAIGLLATGWSTLPVAEACNTPDPIKIVINAHGHANTIVPVDSIYLGAHHEEIIWLMNVAEYFGAYMSLQLNGRYSELLVEDDAASAGGTPTKMDAFLSHLPNGHTTGAHFHTVHNDGSSWVDYSDSSLTQDELTAFVLDAWPDHLDAIELLTGAAPIHVDGSAKSGLSGIDNGLLATHGVKIISSGDAFAGEKWNVVNWNPYRATELGSLSEEPFVDPPTLPLYISSIGQVGLEQPGGKHVIYSSPGQLKRHFLVEYAHWREFERGNDHEPWGRIWSFGIMTHPDQNASYRDQMGEMISFLDGYTSRTTPCGNTVAEFRSDSVLLSEFKAWELWDHVNLGDSSSFDYVSDTFPYDFPELVLSLKDSELEAEITTISQVEVYEFKRRNISRKPTQEINCVLSTYEADSIYMLWSTSGAATIVNFATTIGTPTANTLDYSTGTAVTTTGVSMLSLPVSEKPMLVTKDSSLFTAPAYDPSCSLCPAGCP